MTDDQATKIVEAIDRNTAALTELGEYLAGVREHLMHMRPPEGEGVLMVQPKATASPFLTPPKR